MLTYGGHGEVPLETEGEKKAYRDWMALLKVQEDYQGVCHMCGRYFLCVAREEGPLCPEFSQELLDDWVEKRSQEEKIHDA
jgi:hypothetical protein